MSTDQDPRARRADERERDLIAALARIAPTPELLRGIVALEWARTDVSARVAIPVAEPAATSPGS